MGKKAQRRRREKIEARFADRPALAVVPAAPAGAVLHVTDATFERDVLQHDLPVLVDFWAPWCGPCKLVGPILDELAPAYEGRLRIAKLNTEQNRRVPEAFNVRSIPTMILFKGGQVADVKIGASPRATLERWLDRHAGKAAGEAPAAEPAAERPGLLARLFG